jgi:hypothetical protein
MKRKRGKLSDLFNDDHWAFLCFTEDRQQKAIIMLAAFMKTAREAKKPLSVRHVHLPAGLLWNGRECHAYFVPKKHLDGATLFPALRKHFGYEIPEPGNSVFTLGIPEDEDDALTDGTRLFRQQ